MSIIMLHTKFRDAYDDLLEDMPSPDHDAIYEFVSNYLLDWFEDRGVGHFKIVHEILEELFKKRSKSKSKEERSSSSTEYLMDTLINYSHKTEDQKYIVTYSVLINYITDILVQYTFEGRSNITKYFKEVFIENVDMWGFIMAYSPMLEYYCNNYSNLGQPEREVYAKLRNIFVDYLYASPLDVINVVTLKSDLVHLSYLLRNIGDHNQRPPSTKNKSSFTDSSILKETQNANSSVKESKKIISAIFEALQAK